MLLGQGLSKTEGLQGNKHVRLWKVSTPEVNTHSQILMEMWTLEDS